MELIIGSRQCGKTTKLIEFAHNKSIYIVCSDRNRVRYIQLLAKKLNKNILLPVTIDEFLRMNGFHSSVQFVVDEVIDCFEMMIGHSKTILAANLSSCDGKTYYESPMTIAEKRYLENQIKIRNDKIVELQNKIKGFDQAQLNFLILQTSLMNQKTEV